MKPIIAVLLGDPAGVGPEIVAKACEESILAQNAIPLIIGDRRVFEKARDLIGATFHYHTVTEIADRLGDERQITLLDQQNITTDEYETGKISPHCGRVVAQQIEVAGQLFHRGIIDGLCFAPFNKAAIKAAGHAVESELDLFAAALAHDSPIGEMNVVGDLWTSRVTSHIPLGDIREHLSKEKILDAIRMLHSTLRQAGKADPRIAVCALNPHAGENGTCGMEEIEVIEPAVQAAAKEGISKCWIYSSDTIFARAFAGEFDGVVTMYHDQGQIALKLRGFHEAVTVEAGFNIPVTTPAHGTAFDIAGKGTADPNPFLIAYRIAASMAGNKRS